MYQKNIELIIGKIINDITSKPLTNNGLHSGNSGIALFLFFALKHNFINTDSYLCEYLALCAPEVEEPFPTFCSGEAGRLWLFAYLGQENMLDSDQLLHDNNIAYLKNVVEQLIREDNYDFLHGAIGIIHFLIYSNKLSHGDTKNLILKLMSISKKNEKNGVPFHYDFDSGSLQTDKVNLGLAHGLTSLLKLLLECSHRDVITITELKSFSNNLVDYITGSVNEDTTFNYFPNIVETKASTSRSSRLAWCYGDLSIGYVLYKYARRIGDQKLMTFSLSILHHTTSRNTIQNTQVHDAGICHGSAGVAHIYNKIWIYTNDLTFRNARDFWIKKTIDFAIYEDGVGGFKSYSHPKGYFADYSLLEGSAGIGLVLISYLTNDHSWDYSIMIN